MNNNTNNELIMLGSGILILGLVLGSYSFSTYLEVKELSQKIDFELIDDNNELSSSEKYYKYITIADFLNQKLNKNKNLAIKNSSCVYLDYAHHNAIELYRLTNRKLDMDDTKKSVAAGNVRGLYNMIDNYGTCKKAAQYKSELQNILTDIQKEEKAADNEERMNRFLNGYKERKAREIEMQLQANSPELEQIDEPIIEDYSQTLPQKEELLQDSEQVEQ
ncbi:hypothetical protein IKL64_04740 [bacterium]|nr:hypothetical protein [bacterium]